MYMYIYTPTVWVGYTDYVWLIVHFVEPRDELNEWLGIISGTSRSRVRIPVYCIREENSLIVWSSWPVVTAAIERANERLRFKMKIFLLQLLNEVQRLNEEFEGLNHKLAHERTLAQTLEKSLSHSRQETLEHKITNKDLQAQVQQLRLKIDELTEKL